MSGGGLNIVCLCRALETAWDKDSTVSYCNSCAAININGKATSITESQMTSIPCFYIRNNENYKGKK
jgi:hypothetical protein